MRSVRVTESFGRSIQRERAESGSNPWIIPTTSSSASRFTFSFRPRARCSRGAAPKFGLPPNTQTDPVSLGLPGTLPVMNRKAFDLALKTAVALHAEIAPFTKWDRKNYYYPDLPKNYQISQYDLPFSQGGWLAIPVRKDGGGGGRCGLTRVHLEEDTGKLMHARRRALRGRPQPGGHPAPGDRHRARDPQPGRRAGLPRGAPADPPLPGRLRLRDAGRVAAVRRQRQPAHPQGRPDDRHADRRDQEPEQLPGRREGAAVTRSSGSTRSGRRTA